MYNKLEKSTLVEPPGGYLVWIIVVLELITFLSALIVFRYNYIQDEDIFRNQQSNLMPLFGFVNSVFLISGGFTMALSVNAKDSKKIKFHLGLTLVFAVLFMLLKLIEYYIEISEGNVFGASIFFNFYWMLTVFHFLHVLAAFIILSYFYFKNTAIEKSPYDFKSSAIFWHMCDLIWIILFPVLYLIQI